MSSARLIAAAVFVGALALPAVGSAQEYVVPQIWGNGLLGQAAMSHTRENILNADQNRDTDRRPDQRRSVECSVESMPQAERRDIDREFNRRIRAEGRPAAVLWAREQGRLFRERLERDGVC